MKAISEETNGWTFLTNLIWVFTANANACPANYNAYGNKLRPNIHVNVPNNASNKDRC